MCFYMHRKTFSSEAIISHVQLLHIYLHRGLCAVLSLSVVGTYYNSPDLAPALGDPARKCHFTVHPIFHLAYVQYRWLPTLVRTEQDPIPSLLLFNQVLICVRTFSFKSHICFSFFKCLVFFFIRNFDRSFLEVLAGNTLCWRRITLKRHAVLPNYIMFTQISSTVFLIIVSTPLSSTVIKLRGLTSSLIFHDTRPHPQFFFN